MASHVYVSDGHSCTSTDMYLVAWEVASMSIDLMSHVGKLVYYATRATGIATWPATELTK